MSRLERSITAINRVIGLTVGIAVLAAAMMITYGVATREFFHGSDNWVNECTTYLMGYITFVGSSSVLWENRHLKVDMLSGHLGPAGAKLRRAFIDLIVLCVTGGMVWLSFKFWADAFHSGERSWGMFSIPLWIPYTTLLGGMVLLLIAHVARLYIDWSASRAHAARQ